MRSYQYFILFLVAMMVTPKFVRAGATTQPIGWQPWSDTIFAQARKENKFVLLDLHAVWCHWCHVMDDTTYSDPAVIDLIGRKYIAVGVDADERPDLANRYEDYGWPATIVFGPDGKEIAKRRGYLPPKMMASMLQAIIDDPTPGPSVTTAPAIAFTDQTGLTADVRKALVQRLNETYDSKFGSWGTIQKFMDWDSVEWCLRRAAAGDKDAERMARQTLEEQRNLIDPVWGGVDQYSTDGDWNHPHYEKIMQFQAENLRIYSLAYEQFKNAGDLASARLIYRFLTQFLLGSNGAFYTSQDADVIDGQHAGEYYRLDDAKRRAIGLPRIDQHQYARENGWAISALTVYYGATGDRSALDRAITAARWVMEHRSIDGGGFGHGAADAAGPYLGDTLSMGQAFLDLYEATGDRPWLTKASDAADFIAAHFVAVKAPGVLTVAAAGESPLSPTIEFDENVSAARFANLLSYYTGRKSDRDVAGAALRYICSTDVAARRRFAIGGLLLADAEAAAPPIHIVVFGAKSDPVAAMLFKTALAIPNTYKRLEWYDASEGRLANEDVEYPVMKKAAAFFCTGTACSAPAFTAEQLMERVAK